MPRSRRLFVVVAATTAFTTIGVVFALTVGIPEVDPVQATFAGKLLAPFSQVFCTGEDGQNYVTNSGTWVVNFTDLNPGAHDWSLTGLAATLAGQLTVNTGTDTGWGVLNLNLTTTGGTVQFTGPVTVLTQQVNSNGAFELRGSLDVPILLSSNPTGDYLVANLEAKVKGGPGKDIKGQLGLLARTWDGNPANMAAKYDYSVETPELTC